MVKVEMEQNEGTGITAFIFTSSNGSPDDLGLLDKIKVAVLGNHDRIGNFIQSDTLVIKTRVPTQIIS